jgi:hypothetical protein
MSKLDKAKDADHGRLFGIPYDFRRPSLRRLLGAHWQPGEGMLVPTPFGIGYTLNLASWRSWIVVAVTALLARTEGNGTDEPATTEEEAEIVIEDPDEA